MKQRRLFEYEEKSGHDAPIGVGRPWFLLAIICLSLFFQLPAFAQEQEYRIYLDRDRNPDTGCTALLQDAGKGIAAGGFEYVLRVAVDERVGALELAACEGEEFGAYRVVAPAHALALTNGADLTDHIEIALPLSYLRASGEDVRIVLASNSDHLRQVAPDDNREIIFGPLVFSGSESSASSLLPLPALALLVLGGLIALFGGHGRHPRPQVAAMSVTVIAVSLLSIGLAWAKMRIDVTDGSIGDWNGVDALASGSAALLRFYAVAEDGQLKLRVDARSGRTIPPPRRPFISDPLGLLPQLAPIIVAQPPDEERQSYPGYRLSDEEGIYAANVGKSESEQPTERSGNDAAGAAAG